MEKLNQLLNNKEIQKYYALADNKYYHVEHNINHALRVIDNCKNLASKLNLAPTDKENICIAALYTILVQATLVKTDMQKEVTKSLSAILMMKES